MEDSFNVFRVRSELGAETQKTVESIETIERQTRNLYHAEPAEDAANIPPNRNLNQKAGYLYMRRLGLLYRNFSTKNSVIYL